ncbi:hypothetical protein GCM10025868_09190 [Angustibacter aerolatus]|uniref:Uncharacterized protein n=1 Tax=Angustibacter aerolatus TaxID=1162965 RepID=A0ABQ6JEW4_9ACTN|nr:hypothetical protein GCM10025868_09190 [Angustibacter aerolatus]
MPTWCSRLPSADELDLAVHDALAAGARLTCPCEERPFVRRARVTGPDGLQVELAAWTHPGLVGPSTSPWAEGRLPDVWD